MTSQPASLPAPPAKGLGEAHLGAEDEVPLGWECANPALQIERWCIEATAPLDESR